MPVINLLRKNPEVKTNKIFRHSIFTKLILLLLAAWLVTNLLLFFVFRQIIITPHLRPIHQAIYGYMDYLIRDLGNPPSYEKALDISRHTGIEIKYDSPGKNWKLSKTRNIPFP